jgi:hypothetical protein
MRGHTDAPARVFVCWSGARSLEVATRFVEFLRVVLKLGPGEVFVSTHLEKGARWFEEIVRKLESAEVGILCLTAENLASPWLHFEAGALAKGLHKSATGSHSRRRLMGNRIFTYLHGVAGASLMGPLAQYQSTSTTREDTWRLMQALHDFLFRERMPDEPKSVFERAWPEFERDLKKMCVTIQELVPEFEGWFRRKTFDEPLQECSDQNWIGRYDGARQTHDRLSGLLGEVRAACPRYQVDLYERLLAVVESYSMDIRGLLLKEPPFALGENGTLLIKPGILHACESRRQRIKEILSRILDPLGIPEVDEAAAFWLTDSFDQRKMLVHRLEHRVIEQHERRGPKRTRAHNSGSDLPDLLRTRKLFKSIWDLDRIFAYLLMEYLYPEHKSALDGLNHATRIELERFRATRQGASLMALHYALGAMKAALGKVPPAVLARDEVIAVDSSLVETEQLIVGSRQEDDGEQRLDRGRQVRRTIAEIRALLPRLNAARGSHRSPRMLADRHRSHAKQG